MYRQLFHVPPRTARRWLLVLFLFALLPTLPAVVRGAATLMVDTQRGVDRADCGTQSTPCKTIAYTIAKRTGDGDRLVVEAGVYAERIVIDKSVTILGTTRDGLTRPTVLEGVGTDRIITVQAGATVTIDNVVIQNGKSTAEGAGISNAGNLTLTNSAVQNNALGKFGHEHCDPCVGGGISNRGTLHLRFVTVSGNSANGGFSGNNSPTKPLPNTLDSGGGIYNWASANLTVEISTISGNTASINGGGIYVDGGTVLISTSTISGNSASGIGGVSGSSLTKITNSTIAFNSSGIYGPMTILHSIVAQSTAGPNCAGNPASTDYNLDDGATWSFNQPHDRSHADPKLVALAENPTGPIAQNAGERYTATHALLPGSAAIDAGGQLDGSGCGDRDQRGFTRPQGLACDIGAFEYVPPAGSSSASGTVAGTATAAGATGTTAPSTGAAAPPGTPLATSAMGSAPATGSTTAAGVCTPLALNSPFAFPGFQSQWQQGEHIAPNFWGPTITGGVQEQYAESPGGQRAAQYFDKGRMELTNPASGIVTNGLLANELIYGQLQTGDGTFQSRAAATIPIAGDPDNAGPTYAALGSTAAALLAATPAQTGSAVTTVVAANGSITLGPGGAGGGPTSLTIYDGITQHNVPQAFAQYRDKVGLLTIGYAKSEPFLATVKVAGAQRQVMVQVFERRVLTYTADNPDAFKVEMGNIGQHYYKWRYCAP